MVSKNKKGFTLIELVVVIAIIGIVASILIPSMLGYIRKAKEKELVGDTKSIVDAAAASIGFSYATQDYGSAMTRTYMGSDCGVITSFDLHKAQIKDNSGMNYVEYAISKDIADMIVPNGMNFDFSSYSGSKFDISGKALSDFMASHPDCPGFILIFNRDGGIARLEYSVGSYICIYDGAYTVYRADETGAKFTAV